MLNGSDVPIAAPALPATSAIPFLVGLGIAVTPKLIHEVGQWWDKYGKRANFEINIMKEAFITFCYSVEMESSITLLDKKKQSADNKDYQVPDYFKMDDKGRFPLIYHKPGFKPEKDLLVWLRRLATNNLRQYIEEMLGYIIEYQAYRDTKIFSGEFTYDPTNLFFEELKSWLVELSKASVIDENVLKVVNARIKYLSYINDKRVFNINESVNPTRSQVILHVRDILNNSVVPSIELEISRTSSREYFKSLKIDLEMIIRSSIEFLLFGFRDGNKLPHALIIEELRHPTLPGYCSVRETTSGKLLSICVNSGSLIQFCRKLDNTVYTSSHIERQQQQAVVTNDPEKEIFNNKFIKPDETLCFPFEDANKNLTLENWYCKENSGIAEYFKEPQLMREYLRLHGLIQKLALFVMITDMFYELAGMGGDILVYGVAKLEIEKTLLHSRKLLESIQATLSYLFANAESYQSSMIKKIESKHEKWLNIFPSIRGAVDRCNFHTKRSFETLDKISQDKIKVNSDEYAGLIRRKLNLLSSCVNQFVQPSLSFKSDLNVPSSYFYRGQQDRRNFSIFPPNTIPISLPATNPQALYDSALSDIALGKFEEALTTFRKMMRDLGFKNDANVILAKAAAYIGLKKYHKALKSVTSVLKNNPDNAQAMELQALLQSKGYNTLTDHTNENSVKRPDHHH